jgi:hypothetical protein
LQSLTLADSCAAIRLFGRDVMEHKTRTGRIVTSIALAGLLLVADRAAAQDDRLTPGRGPSVSVSVGAVPTASTGNPGEQYGYRDAGLAVSVPIKGGWDWGPGGALGFRLMAHAGFHTDSAVVPYRPDRRQLLSIDAGVSAIHVLSRDNQISWSVGAGIAQDSDTLSSPKLRLSGRVVALHRSSQTLTLLYGGAYTFLLGKGRMLPIFGVLWRPNPGTTVHLLGPISGGIQHRLASRLIVGGQAGLRGNQYRIASTERFPSTSGDLLLRVRELRVGGSVRALVGRALALSAEGGVAAARRLAVVDGTTEKYSSTVGAQPYATIGLRISFSKQPRWDGLGGW